MTTSRSDAHSSWSLLIQSANLLSASRFVLAGIWALVFFGEHPQPQILGAIAITAAASDIIDGRIARWTQSTGQFGRWLDNVADIAFVLTALSCAAYAGAIPVYVPALVAASFVQYVADSVLIRGSSVPVKSRLGHWGGILNYLIVVALAMVPPPWPGMLARQLPRLIALFYLAAMCERAWYYGPVGRLVRDNNPCASNSSLESASGAEQSLSRS